MPCSRKALRVLLCSTVSNAFFEVSGRDPQWLVPLGGSLSKLVECVHAFRRGVA